MCPGLKDVARCRTAPRRKATASSQVQRACWYHRSFQLARADSCEGKGNGRGVVAITSKRWIEEMRAPAASPASESGWPPDQSPPSSSTRPLANSATSGSTPDHMGSSSSDVSMPCACHTRYDFRLNHAVSHTPSGVMPGIGAGRACSTQQAGGSVCHSKGPQSSLQGGGALWVRWCGGTPRRCRC